jgi:MFS family permease
MFLTLQRRRLQIPDSPDKFPTAQLALLGKSSMLSTSEPLSDNRPIALVRASEPIAHTSIFPYAWKLVLYYDVCPEQDAAFYAGLLIAAFSFAEAITGIFWGSLSDRIGRKKVLLFGNAGTLLSMLVVGFARNFWVALAGRILGGLLNGNIGVIQVMKLLR